jgi:tRNA uridine 5-carbamoylmethylation protein Kti12
MGPLVIIVTGPIGAGKSTVAEALAVRLRRTGRLVAAVDLDEVVVTIGGFAGLTDEAFAAARQVHGQVVRSWLDVGADVVVDGPFYSQDEEAPLLAALPPGAELRRVRLLVPYDVALERVTNDAMPRNASKDPHVLRRLHDRFDEMLTTMPEADLTYATAELGADEIAAAIASALTPDPLS